VSGAPGGEDSGGPQAPDPVPEAIGAFGSGESDGFRGWGAA